MQHYVYAIRLFGESAVKIILEFGAIQWIVFKTTEMFRCFYGSGHVPLER